MPTAMCPTSQSMPALLLIFASHQMSPSPFLFKPPLHHSF